MTTAYHIAGAANTVLYGAALYGFGSQLVDIWRRRRAHAAGRLPEAPTAILSLNIFVVSFIGYFGFYLYGTVIEPFNIYLVWTRLPGSLLVLTILFEIARDRRTRRTALAFGASLVATLLGLAQLIAGERGLLAEGRAVSQVLMVAVLVLVLQGLVHQILLIRRRGATGAVSLRMHLGTGLKDVSLLAFGLTMGVATGWPLIGMSIGSLTIKAILIWHFRWVRRSPVAARRRALVVAAASPGSPAADMTAGTGGLV